MSNPFYWSYSPFPDCSICKRQADDGGWLDNKNYRFWVCIECDDWLDEKERHNKEKDDWIDEIKRLNKVENEGKKMKLTSPQFEAIISAMFKLENEIDTISHQFAENQIKDDIKEFATESLKRKQIHYNTFKKMIEK